MNKPYSLKKIQKLTKNLKSTRKNKVQQKKSTTSGNWQIIQQAKKFKIKYNKMNGKKDNETRPNALGK